MTYFMKKYTFIHTPQCLFTRDGFSLRINSWPVFYHSTSMRDSQCNKCKTDLVKASEQGGIPLLIARAWMEAPYTFV